MRGETENVEKEGEDHGRQRKRETGYSAAEGRRRWREKGREKGYGRERSGEERTRERKERDERSSPYGSLATEVIYIARRPKEREGEKKRRENERER